MVSVVIPVYNRVNLLRQCLDSVFNQDFSDLEVIVVDDASDEDVPGVLRFFPDKNIIYIRHNKNLGVSSSRNSGIAAAHGEYIAFLDGDDFWLKNTLAALVAALADHSQVNCVFGVTIRRESAGIHYTPGVHFFTTRDELFKILCGGCCLHFQSFMARRDCFVSTGVFDEKLRNLEDWDMCLRLARDVSVGVLSRVLTDSRYCPSGESTNKDNLIAGGRYLLSKHKRYFTRIGALRDFYFAMAHIYAIYGLPAEAKKFLKDLIIDCGHDARAAFFLFVLSFNWRFYRCATRVMNFFNYLVVKFFLRSHKMRIFVPLSTRGGCE